MIKRIENTNNAYGVDEEGNVYSYRKLGSKTGALVNTPRKMSCHPGGTSPYLTVGLMIEGFKKYYLVHRLVAEAFVPNPENKNEVDHIDGNVLNNQANNLQWVTREENLNKAKGDRSTANGFKSKCVLYSPFGEKLQEFESISAAAKYAANLGCSESGMKRNHKSKGYWIEAEYNEKIEQKKRAGIFRGRECYLVSPSGEEIGPFASISKAGKFLEALVGPFNIPNFQIRKRYAGYTVVFK